MGLFSRRRRPAHTAGWQPPERPQVEWYDREVFLLAAPTLCADGVLACAALTLLDDRVRSTG